MADFTAFGKPTTEWLSHEMKYGFPLTAPIGSMPPEKIQEATNAGRELASEEQMKEEGLYDKVNIQTIEIPSSDGYSIPARIYSPKPPSVASLLPVYVFYHGGGFIYGTLSSEDAACARIVASMPIIVINICYRHTPQFTYRIAHNDAVNGFDWVVANLQSFGGDPENIMLGGISAGANLAAAVVLRENARIRSHSANVESEKRLVRIKGQILCIPWLVVRTEVFPYHLLASRETCSRYQCANAPILPSSVVHFFNQLMGLTANDYDVDIGLVDDEDVVGTPMTAFLIAGNDPLRDDGLLFARKLHQNGVPTKVHIFPGLPHGFRRFNDLPSNRRWDELVVESIKWALGNQKLAAGTDVTIAVEVPSKAELNLGSLHVR